MNKSTGSIRVTDLTMTDIANIFRAIACQLETIQDELLEEQRMKDQEKRIQARESRQFAYAAILAEQEERILP